MEKYDPNKFLKRGMRDCIEITSSDILLEETFQIDRDVDYLYNKGFKKWVNEFKHGYYHYPDTIEVPTSELISKDCKKGNTLNPCIIYLGLFNFPSVYKNALHTIYITPDVTALTYFITKNSENKIVSKNDIQRYKGEMTEQRLKALISHEISHWLRDTLFNNQITKYNRLKNILSAKDIAKLYEKNVNLTYFEIDAQIHAIAQLKRKRADWNEITLTDLFQSYNSITNLLNNLYYNYGENKELRDIWIKYILKRMYREHLLGKNMINTFDLKFILNWSQGM